MNRLSGNFPFWFIISSLICGFLVIIHFSSGQMSLPPPPPAPNYNNLPIPKPSPLPKGSSRVGLQDLESNITSSVSPFSGLPICKSSVCILDGTFIFSNPVEDNGNNQPDATYRYGFTQKSRRPIHHGVDLKNNQGTPVLAAADGQVIAAGNDKEITVGLKPGFYGNYIIIKHAYPQFDKPVYSLYGHLSEINIEQGQMVKCGQVIGHVGMTGIAIGYHLHFEVRYGENTYQQTRNPELWMKLDLTKNEPMKGALAGRITNSNGEPMRISRVVINRLDVKEEETPIYLDTYDDPPIPHKTGSRDDSYLMPSSKKELGREDGLQEDFALAGLPPGKYTISFTSQVIHKTTFDIKPGQLTFINFIADY